MKKIPSLFVRDWNGDKSRVTRELNPECQWVVDGEGVATRKRDGTACLVRGGMLFRRYDAKKGKTPPPGFEPCGEPDVVTGHHPGWLPVGDGPQDRWYHDALWPTEDGTYELCGPKLQTNPEGLEVHTFFRHGGEILSEVPRDFDGLVAYLRVAGIEGIVWHHPDGRMAKIKSKDFGLEWPVHAKKGES